MHYQVDGLLIRSENAAKPAAQASRYLLDWLRRRPVSRDGLDFGCGKLRYSRALRSRSVRLTVVDSAIQIDRVQRLRGRTSSVRDYARKYMKATRALSIEEFSVDRRKYDFILCANVLSTVPLEEARDAALARIVQALAPTGKCLFVTQYRNSYFKTVAALPNATRHLDGWILKTGRGSFFYGLISLEALVDKVRHHGLQTHEEWVHEGSAFVLAGHNG